MVFLWSLRVMSLCQCCCVFLLSQVLKLRPPPIISKLSPKLDEDIEVEKEKENLPEEQPARVSVEKARSPEKMVSQSASASASASTSSTSSSSSSDASGLVHTLLSYIPFWRWTSTSSSQHHAAPAKHEPASASAPDLKRGKSLDISRETYALTRAEAPSDDAEFQFPKDRRFKRSISPSIRRMRAHPPPPAAAAAAEAPPAPVDDATAATDGLSSLIGYSRTHAKLKSRVDSESVQTAYSRSVSESVLEKGGRHSSHADSESSFVKSSTMTSESSDEGLEGTVQRVHRTKRRMSLHQSAFVHRVKLHPDDAAAATGSFQSLLSEDHVRWIQLSLPMRFRGCDWKLVYSVKVHGWSLRTLYSKSAALANESNGGACILVLKSDRGRIAGAFSPVPFEPHGRKYYGTGETFVFSIQPQQQNSAAAADGGLGFRVFRWSHENDYFLYSTHDALAIGEGALYLDSTLFSGSSKSCATFRNDKLVEEGDFEIDNLEIWSFTKSTDAAAEMICAACKSGGCST